MSTEWIARSDYCAYYVFVTPCSVRHGMDTYRSETEQLLSLLAAAGAASESSDERRSGQSQHGSQASREPPAISRRRKVWIGKKTGCCLCLLATGERGAAFAGLRPSLLASFRIQQRPSAFIVGATRRKGASAFRLCRANSRSRSRRPGPSADSNKRHNTNSHRTRLDKKKINDRNPHNNQKHRPLIHYTRITITNNSHLIIY